MHGSNSAGPVGDMAKGFAQQTQDARMKEVGANDQTLDQFSGPVTSTPYYRQMVTAGRASTDRAFQTARAGQRAQANASGFGYTNPVAQGSDAGLRAQGAAAEAQVPVQAAIQATGPVMQAAGVRANEAASLNPSSELSTAQQGYQFNQQQNSGMMRSLLKLGLMGASFIPGVGPVAGAAMKGMSGTL